MTKHWSGANVLSSEITCVHTTVFGLNNPISYLALPHRANARPSLTAPRQASRYRASPGLIRIDECFHIKSNHTSPHLARPHLTPPNPAVYKDLDYECCSISCPTKPRCTKPYQTVLDITTYSLCEVLSSSTLASVARSTQLVCYRGGCYGCSTGCEFSSQLLVGLAVHHLD